MMPASSPTKAAPSALPDFSFLSGVVRLVRSKQAMSWLDQGLVSATGATLLSIELQAQLPGSEPPLPYRI